MIYSFTRGIKRYLFIHMYYILIVLKYEAKFFEVKFVFKTLNFRWLHYFYNVKIL